MWAGSQVHGDVNMGGDACRVPLEGLVVFCSLHIACSLDSFDGGAGFLQLVLGLAEALVLLHVLLWPLEEAVLVVPLLKPSISPTAAMSKPLALLAYLPFSFALQPSGQGGLKSKQYGIPCS